MINKVIRVLIASDFLLQGGWGLVGPIFAIFVTRQIAGGTVASVGFIVATYWLTKSVIQPFLARLLDARKGERDDFVFLVAGMYVANLVPLGYIISTELWHLFLLEFVRGLAMACVVPAWSGIFTRHIDKGKEAFSWSMESTGLGIAAGLAAAFGGVIATGLGFKVVFLLTSVFGLLASTALLLIRNKISPRNGFVPRIPPKTKLLQ